jgi:hypothetical protein
MQSHERSRVGKKLLLLRPALRVSDAPPSSKEWRRNADAGEEFRGRARTHAIKLKKYLPLRVHARLLRYGNGDLSPEGAA